MADERVFKITIDGLEKSYKDTVKLVDALNSIKDVHSKVTVETDKVNKATSESTNRTKEKTKALTDEEKAIRKLEQTLARKESLDTDLGRLQVEANQQLRERSQLLNRQIQLDNASTGSIDEKRLQIASLTGAFRALSEEERNSEHIGGAMLRQIQELRTEYNELERSLGNHTVDVGNYGIATAGLTEQLNSLGEGINKTSEEAKGMLSLFQAGVGIALMFDEENSELSKTMNSLGKILAIVGALQQANNTLVKNGTILQKARVLVDALVTKGIISQTVAQTALNIATKAFPLLAFMAIIGAVIGLLSSYSKKTKEAANDTENLSSKTETLKKESEQTASSLASSIVVYKRLQKQWNDLANDLDRKKQFVTDNKNEFNSLGIEVNNVNDAESVLVTNTDAVIKSLKLRAQAAAAQQIATEKYAEALKKQDEAERRGKNPTQQEVAHGKNIYSYEDRDGFKNVPTYQGNELAIEASKPIKEEGEKLLKEADDFFDKYIDLTNKSTEELTSVGIKAATKLGNNVTNTTRNTGDELAKIREDLDSERIKAIENMEQREIATIQNNLQKRLSSIKGNSEEEKELKKLLTENSERDIANIRKKYQEQREKEEKESNKKLIDEQKTLLDIQTTYLQNFYDDIQDLQKEAKGKNGIIDVEATKANLDEANTQLLQYISLLNNSKKDIEAYYDSLLKLYDKDSVEYKKILSEKENTLRDYEKKEKDVGKQIAENTKTQTDLQAQYYEELANKMQKVVDTIMMGVTAVFDAVGSVMQAQLDDANEKYEAISQKYDEVVAKREESSNRINELEEEAKSARGGRALVLQEQINSEMEANKQLANQEKQLAKEKEKQEKEIAKKEKQQKKMNLVSDIVSGVANTALGVTKALGSAPPPFNFALAALVGAMGAIQVGVMTKQLTKLEDGGLLKGKRHSNGGMRVEGTNIEVEGGEYVVNRESTAKNIGLIRYINNERRELKPTDLNSFFSRSSKGFEPPFKRMFETGGQLPTINTSVNVDNEILIDAIKSMKIEPKVAVTDINNAQEDVVKVDNWTGL